MLLKKDELINLAKSFEKDELHQSKLFNDEGSKYDYYLFHRKDVFKCKEGTEDIVIISTNEDRDPIYRLSFHCEDFKPLLKKSRQKDFIKICFKDFKAYWVDENNETSLLPSYRLWKISSNGTRFVNGEIMKVIDSMQRLRYEGGYEYINGRYLKSGKGIEYYGSGIIQYDGEFKDDRFHGFGQLCRPNKLVICQGSFESNRFKGYGNIYLKGSLIYTGEIDEVPNGKGTYFWGDGTRTEGILKKGKFEGKCITYDIDGKYLHDGEPKEKKGCVDSKIFLSSLKALDDGVAEIVGDKLITCKW